MVYPLLLSFIFFSPVLSQPAQLSFTDCFRGNVSQKMEISAVYGQVVHRPDRPPFLNLTVFGTSPVQVLGTGPENLATLFTSTSILTLSAYNNPQYLCIPLRPPSPLPPSSDDINGYLNKTYCPLAAGPFALSSTIPMGPNRALSTLTTRLHALDPGSQETLCLQVSTTSVNTGKYGDIYGEAIIIFWASVALAIAYWVTVGIARLSSAWGRGMRQKHNLWARVESAGFILASALSGEGFSTSPALLRFCTPSLRDIIFHVQWCSALAMVAVQWPTFAYPLLTQTAWATLVYNITLTSPSTPHRWNPLTVEPFEPPSGFADQVTDPNSSLYIDPSEPNILFRLPDNATHGMSSFAYTIGVRPEDLWHICIIIFLGLIAGAMALSFLVWFIDWVATYVSQIVGGRSSNKFAGTVLTSGSKDMLDAPITQNLKDEDKSLNGGAIFRTTSRYTLPLASGSGVGRKGWWRCKPPLNSFHGSVLQGNLVRLLILFHLPVTIFSCYEMTRPKTTVAVSSIALSALTFIFFSILIPILLVIRVRMTNTNKLYDETRTLLAYGPLYNHYRHGSQMFAGLFFASNLAFGIAIGCGQKSGTAQAVVILVVEVISALVTSIWLPWGYGASMGLISFLFCVGRIVIAVLLVILAPAIQIGHGPSGWVAYGILLILALVFLALALLFAVKVIEGFVRIIGGVGFDRSNHVVDSGLLGACGLLGCCGGRRRRPNKRNRGKYRSTNQSAPSSSGSYPPSARPDLARDKESINSAPTPSVLRPEQAMRPYQEDRDDENGFIMGAWRGAQGYQHINTSPTPPPAKPSGFSRIGGGRAHYDTPYNAIKTQPEAPTPLKTFTIHNDDRDEEPITNTHHSEPRAESSVPVPVLTNEGLPPGAMKPLHARTRSQTAIIEDAGIYLGTSSKAEPNKPSHPPSSFNNNEESKKRPWYRLGRNRPRSAGDDRPSSFDEGPAQSTSADASPTRSFVVIRGNNPQQPRQRQVSDVGPTSPGLEGAETPSKGSFVVVRKNQGGSLSLPSSSDARRASLL